MENKVEWKIGGYGQKYIDYKLGTIHLKDDGSYMVKYGVNEAPTGAKTLSEAKKQLDKYTESKTPKMAKGGDIEREMKLNEAVVYKDKTHYITEKDGVVGLMNFQQGAWGSDHKFIPLSKIRVYDEVTDMNGRRVFIPYSFDKFENGGGIDSKSSYEAMLSKYDKLGAYLEDAIEDKNTSEATRLKAEMSALETKINNYERGGNSFSYSIGGL